MKTLYLECNMGAAGDMLTAALLELTDCPEQALQQLRQIGLPGVQTTAVPAQTCGIHGTRIELSVFGAQEGKAHGQEHGLHLADIFEILDNANLPKQVCAQAKEIYQSIAEAESAVHQTAVAQVHFHEVGMLDAIADVVHVCYLLDLLSPEQIIVSPVATGFGQAHTAHGILPVPAPATALLLRDIPTYSGTVQGELCTPTGAALLRYFATAYGNQPLMRVEKIGYGIGTKIFPKANCVRAFLGETESPTEEILELKCNLDDMTGEAIGFAVEQLLAAGALDVFTAPIQMKKNRPAVLLTCLCRKEQREQLLHQLFYHTTTLGVRETICPRYTLQRTQRRLETPWGSIRIKSADGYGVHREKPEYEDIKAIAQREKLSLQEVTQQIQTQRKQEETWEF